MTTYQRRGGQYKTRSGATAYRKGVKGQRGKATVKRSTKRFYAKNRPLCLGVGAAVLATAWVHAPVLVVGAAAFAGVGLAAPHVRRGVKRWRSWQATPVRKAGLPTADKFYARQHQPPVSTYDDGRLDGPADYWRAWQQRLRKGSPRPSVTRSVRWRGFEFEWEPTNELNRPTAATPDHPFKAGGRPPLFMCATCNQPHPRKAAAA